MSDLVRNPEDRFSRITAHLLQRFLQRQDCNFISLSSYKFRLCHKFCRDQIGTIPKLGKSLCLKHFGLLHVGIKFIRF